jgi:ABC-type antimicrobial peptide transport system permease subunit
MVVLLITLAAALYPALKIRRLKPVEAMNVS